MTKLNLRAWNFLRFFIVLFVTMPFLGACEGGAVVFAPTPLPPDQSPARYEHPSRAFSLVAPRMWAVYTQNVATLASASFTPDGESAPMLRVSVVRLPSTPDTAQFAALIDQYQSQVRADVARYTEQGRSAMGDGSWRMGGIRQSVGGEAQQINTFIQRNGDLFAVMEVVLPPNNPSAAQRLAELQGVLNSIRLDTAAALAVSDLSTLASAQDTALQIARAYTWVTAQGVLFVSGEVRNGGSTTATATRVRAVLIGADGREVAEAVDLVMGYGIAPNGFAPFSLRFGQGQPVGVVRYRLEIIQDEAIAAPSTIYSGNELTWTDDAVFTADGILAISGTVANTSGQTIRNPRAVVTVFDRDGNVVAAAYNDLITTTLAPNDTAPYSLLIAERGGDMVNYLVQIQAVP
jgi:hypothetical protein